MQSECFCFRRQGNDVAVVGGEYTDRLSVQAGMEYLLYRAEEAVAIDQGVHGGKGSGTGFVDRIGDRSPHREVVFGVDLDFGIVRVGRT